MQVDADLDLAPLLLELHRALSSVTEPLSAEITPGATERLMYRLCRSRGQSLRRVALSLPEIQSAHGGNALLKLIDDALHDMRRKAPSLDAENVTASGAPGVKGKKAERAAKTALPLQPSSSQQAT